MHFISDIQEYFLRWGLIHRSQETKDFLFLRTINPLGYISIPISTLSETEKDGLRGILLKKVRKLRLPLF